MRKQYVVLTKNGEPVLEVSTPAGLAQYFSDFECAIGDTFTVGIVDEDGNDE